MQVDFFGNSVRCETDGHMVSLTDLATAGNKHRAVNAMPIKPLIQVLNSVAFSEFKAVAEKDMPDMELLRVEGRGNTKRTMGHLFLAVFVAEQYSTEFHYKVIKTFMEGKLLEFRELGGTEFKTLNAAIDLYLPDRQGKDNKGVYIQSAIKLRTRILGSDTDWGGASVAQTHTRYDFERRLVDMLRVGVVRDWEHLKELIEKI